MVEVGKKPNRRAVVRWATVLVVAVSVCSLLFVAGRADWFRSEPKQYSVVVSDTLCRMDSAMVADSAMLGVIDLYRDSIAQMLGEVLCTSDEELAARRPDSGLGRVVADMLLHSARNFAAESHMAEPECALANVGGLRNTLPQGDVTLQNVYEIMPFQNTLVVVTLKGAELRSMIQHVARRGGEALAGITFTLDNFEAKDIKVAGQPIDDERVYHLATLDYLASGGDSFEMLKSCEHVSSDLLIRDLFVGYLKTLHNQGKSLTAPADVRISVVDKDEK